MPPPRVSGPSLDTGTRPPPDRPHEAGRAGAGAARSARLRSAYGSAAGHRRTSAIGRRVHRRGWRRWGAREGGFCAAKPISAG